ncbi:sigma-54 dependent transcriptional regulator [Aquifex pyrophilus]
MRVLVVEDDVAFGKLLEEFLSLRGHEVHLAKSGSEAFKKLEEHRYEVILLDLLLPDINGMEILKKVKKDNQFTEVIVITGHGTIRTAVEAMKLGALDFLTKPCSLEEIDINLKRAFETVSIKKENKLLKREKYVREKYEEYVFESPAMKEVLRKAERISCADCPVLITGETGTGKEVIARYIHKLSDRSSKPMVAVNVASIPENLVEAELFGYERGAFTGATTGKEGFFELANGGTIFLDEIGELNHSVQAKLLRVLENGSFYRLGGRKEMKTDARVIAATNRDLKKLVEEGRFREDLYYRLNVVEIHIPPLRERKEDIIPLAKHFLRKFSSKYGKRLSELSREAEEVLLSYHWPGNVRELRNIIERVVLFSDEEKEVVEKEELSCLTYNSNLKPIELIEREQILKTLREVNNNKKKAAEILGIPLRTFYRKLKKYGIE